MRRRALLLLAALALPACTASRAAGFLITRPFRMPVVGAPFTPHEDVRFKTDDGLTLRGWLFRPAKAPRGLVVLLHGKDINRQHLSAEAGRFVDKGFAVLLYDQRAHGASEGTTVTYGVREVPDLQRGLDAVGITPVYVIGESLGAAVALQAAAVEPRIHGVVAGASFAELTTVIEEFSPFSDATTRAGIAEAERDWGFKAADVAPARAAKQIRVPALLLHGTEDMLIKPAHSYRIYESLAGPRRLVLLEGVSHQGVLLHEEAWLVVDAWLEDVAAGGTGDPRARTAPATPSPR